MHIFIALGLLIVCGIVDATFYNPRSQTFNQLMGRQQRSIPIPYSYGYHYNPIEPSINVFDSLSEGLDSRINMFKPIDQNVKMSIHDVNSVPRTHSYQPKNSLYDSEYITVQDIPNLFPEEESVDYKYLGSPLMKYFTRPPTTESDMAINLVAIKKTSVFSYGFPTYKPRYSSDSLWNFGSQNPNTAFEDSQLVKSNPETLKVSFPFVTIVKLLPETLEQEPTINTTKNPFDVLEKIFKETQNEVKNSVEDELNDEITQETPTEDESNSIATKENQTEDESKSKTSEETLILDESNSQVFEENSTKDESSFITTEETLTEDESNSITTEENRTEDESNSITTEENRTEDDSNSKISEETLILDESNSRVLEENPTKDESSFITTEETLTEDESISVTTEENQTEDELDSTTSLEKTTDFILKYYPFNKNRNSKYDKYIQSKIKDLIKRGREQNKSQFKTAEEIPTIFNSYSASDENTDQQMDPQLAIEPDAYKIY